MCRKSGSATGSIKYDEPEYSEADGPSLIPLHDSNRLYIWRLAVPHLFPSLSDATMNRGDFIYVKRSIVLRFCYLATENHFLSPTYDSFLPPHQTKHKKHETSKDNRSVGHGTTI